MLNVETLDIQATLNGMLVPSADQEQLTACFNDIVEHIGRTEPPAATPRQEIHTEYSYLAELSQARSVWRQRSTQTFATFVTRSATGRGIDAIYEQYDDGHVQIRTRLQDQLDEPCIISTFGGVVTVATQRYYRGTMHEVEELLEPGERGEKLYRACIGSMLWASHLALTRSGGERSDADTAARALMLRDIRRDYL